MNVAAIFSDSSRSRYGVRVELFIFEISWDVGCFGYIDHCEIGKLKCSGWCGSSSVQF